MVNDSINEARSGAINRQATPTDSESSDMPVPDERLVAADASESMAKLCMAAGNPVDARQQFKKALELRIATYGDQHLEVARTRMLLSDACELMGDLGETVEQVKAAFAVYRCLNGPQHEDAMNALKRSIAVQDVLRRKSSAGRSDVSWVG